jgi:hypothetical protein
MSTPYRETETRDPAPTLPDPPEIVLLDTIRKLDLLDEDKVHKVLRALNAYYEDE